MMEYDGPVTERFKFAQKNSVCVGSTHLISLSLFSTILENIELTEISRYLFGSLASALRKSGNSPFLRYLFIRRVMYGVVL